MPLVDTSIVAAHLAEAIRFPTIAPRAPDSDATTFATLHEYLARTYPRLHAQTVRDIVGTRSLHYEWRSKDASASHVVLMGHLDVVPALPGTEALWAYAP